MIPVPANLLLFSSDRVVKFGGKLDHEVIQRILLLFYIKPNFNRVIIICLNIFRT